MDEARDIYSMIRRVVYEETIYLRHYLGKVLDNEDSLTQGRVLVQITDLGWGITNNGGDDPGTAAWCNARAIHGMDVPKKDDWVEVYFLAGDMRKPVYIALATEMKGMVCKAYSGTSKRVIFQDPDSGDSIIYDKDTKELTIKVTKFTVNDGNLEVT